MNDEKQPVDVTGHRSEPSRRDALKALLGGAGIVAGGHALPEKWIKPVVSSVILPAHAQSSMACEITEFSINEAAMGSSEMSLEFNAPGVADGTNWQLSLTRSDGGGGTEIAVVEGPTSGIFEGGLPESSPVEGVDFEGMADGDNVEVEILVEGLQGCEAETEITTPS